MMDIYIYVDNDYSLPELCGGIYKLYQHKSVYFYAYVGGTSGKHQKCEMLSKYQPIKILPKRHITQLHHMFPEYNKEQLEKLTEMIGNITAMKFYPEDLNVNDTNEGVAR